MVGSKGAAAGSACTRGRHHARLPQHAPRLRHALAAGLLLLRRAAALRLGHKGAGQALPCLAADRHPQRLDFEVSAVAAAWARV